MEDSGSYAHANSPQEFAAFIKAERPKWAHLIKTAGAKAEQSLMGRGMETFLCRPIKDAHRWAPLSAGMLRPVCQTSSQH